MKYYITWDEEEGFRPDDTTDAQQWVRPASPSEKKEFLELLAESGYVWNALDLILDEPMQPKQKGGQR